MSEWEDQAPESIDAWRHIRQANTRSPLSTWEQDDMFLAFALIYWPKDMVLVSRGSYKSQSPRSRMRTRHECFAALWEVLAPQGEPDGSQSV